MATNKYKIDIETIFESTGTESLFNSLRLLTKQAGFLTKELKLMADTIQKVGGEGSPALDVLQQRMNELAATYTKAAKALASLSMSEKKAAELGLTSKSEISKEEILENVLKLVPAINNAKNTLINFNQYLKVNSSVLDKVEKKIINVRHAMENYTFSIEKQIDVKKRWTSEENIQKARQVIAVINKQKEELNKLTNAYQRYKVELEKAIEAGDIIKYEKFKNLLNETAKNIDKLNKKFKETKVQSAPAIESLSKLNRMKWLTEVGKRALGYAAIFTGIYSAAQAIKEAIVYTVEMEKAQKTLQAVLNTSSIRARNLEKAFIALGQAYGGTLKEINEAALLLGRAGIDVKDLAKATEIVIQMSMLTGDSFRDSTNALVIFKENYEDLIRYTEASGQSALEAIGNKLAYIANASRLATQDIGTFANYALSTAKTIGLTIDMVGALAIAFNNAGVAASTIGTSIRRFGNLLQDSSTATKEFFDSIGIDRALLLKQLQRGLEGTAEGAKASNEAFLYLGETIASLTNEQFNRLIGGMDILAADFLKKVRANYSAIKKHFDVLISGQTAGLKDAKIIAESYLNVWQRFKNLLGELSSVISDSVLKPLNAIAVKLLEIFGTETEKKLAELSLQYGKIKDTIKYLKEVDPTNPKIDELTNQLARLKKEIEALGKVSEEETLRKKLAEKIANVISVEQLGAGAYGRSRVGGLLNIIKQGDLETISRYLTYLKNSSDEVNQKLYRMVIGLIAADEKLRKLFKPLIPEIKEVKQQIDEIKKTEGKGVSFEFINKEQVKALKDWFSILKTNKSAFSDYVSRLETVRKVSADLIKKQLEETVGFIRKNTETLLKSDVGKKFANELISILQSGRPTAVKFASALALINKTATTLDSKKYGAFLQFLNNIKEKITTVSDLYEVIEAINKEFNKTDAPQQWLNNLINSLDEQLTKVKSGAGASIEVQLSMIQDALIEKNGKLTEEQKRQINLVKQKAKQYEEINQKLQDRINAEKYIEQLKEKVYQLTHNIKNSLLTKVELLLQSKNLTAEERKELEEQYTLYKQIIEERNKIKLQDLQIGTSLKSLDIQHKFGHIGTEEYYKNRIELLKKQIEVVKKQMQFAQDEVAIEQLKQRIIELQGQIEETEQKLVQFSGSFEQGFVYGLEEFIRRARTVFEIAKQLAIDTAQAMGKAFSSFFFDLMIGQLKTLGDYIRAFLTSVAKAISDYISQLLVNKAIQWLMGAAFSGGTGIVASAGGSVAPAHIGGYVSPIGIKYHTGGEVKKYHSGGLTSDEYFAILQTGEGVLSRVGLKTLGLLNQGIVPSNNAPQHITININAVDARSFEELANRNPNAIIMPVMRALRMNSSLRYEIRGG